MVTGLDLDRIEETARAADPEPRWWTPASLRSAMPHIDPQDAAHVATMAPATTLALVARVRELEAEMGERIFWLDQDAGLIAEAMERLSAAEAQLKGRCLADITLRDDDHRMVTCILPEGHTFEHDDGMGCLWTDGGHRVADHSDAARLAAVGGPTVIDAARLERQRQWSLDTFGPGPRTLGVLDHIRRELDEVAADPTDLTEWVDVVLIALDGAWRAGHEPQAILDALAAKQDLNQERAWPDWRGRSQDEAIEHIRGGGAQ